MNIGLNMGMTVKIMIMAGGTGGHIFPALAVATHLRDQGAEIMWLGTRHGMEAELVPKAGFDIEWISIAGLRGKGALSWLFAPFKLMLAITQALIIFRRCRPMAVLGMGGFASGPGGVVSRLLGIPLVIHEQNAVAGLTNRLLSRLAGQCLQAFPDALPQRCAAAVVGNPVRADIAALPDPQQRFAGRSGALRLLVLGGSLGAQSLNQVVPEMLKCLPENVLIEVRHQAGKNKFDETRQVYAEANSRANVAAEVTPFIADMAEAYGWADIVLCRAGALTIAELAAAGVAAILIPFPYAVDDHQTVNAAYLADAGAAVLIPQNKLNAQMLADKIISITTGDGDSRAQLLIMANKARDMALIHATEQVARVCMEAAHNGRR